MYRRMRGMLARSAPGGQAGVTSSRIARCSKAIDDADNSDSGLTWNWQPMWNATARSRTSTVR